MNVEKKLIIVMRVDHDHETDGHVGVISFYREH